MRRGDDLEPEPELRYRFGQFVHALDLDKDWRLDSHPLPFDTARDRWCIFLLTVATEYLQFEDGAPAAESDLESETWMAQGFWLEFPGGQRICGKDLEKDPRLWVPETGISVDDVYSGGRGRATYCTKEGIFVVVEERDFLLGKPLLRDQHDIKAAQREHGDKGFIAKSLGTIAQIDTFVEGQRQKALLAEQHSQVKDMLLVVERYVRKRVSGAGMRGAGFYSIRVCFSLSSLEQWSALMEEWRTIQQSLSGRASPYPVPGVWVVNGDLFEVKPWPG